MTIEEHAQSIGTVPSFSAILPALESIARGLHAKALAYGIRSAEERKKFVADQLVMLDKLCGWDIEDRTQEFEEMVYGWTALMAELAYRRGV
jgi:hypothetical protein